MSLTRLEYKLAEPTEFTERFKKALESLGKGHPALGYDAESNEPTIQGVEAIPKDDKPAQFRLAKVTNINLFQQPEAHPVVLDLVLLKKYGPEWMDWEAETLVWRIPKDFRTSGVSDLTLDKIQAIKTLHVSTNFWLKWEVFNWCLHPFNNLYPDFQMMQVPSTAQVMIAVWVASVVRSDVSWSEEVLAFMKTACRHDGIFYPPKPLDFLVVGPENDFVQKDPVLNRWPEVLRTGQAPTQDTIADEQLRRMLDAHNFLGASRMRLQDQLPLVLNE